MKLFEKDTTHAIQYLILFMELKECQQAGGTAIEQNNLIWNDMKLNIAKAGSSRLNMH